MTAGGEFVQQPTSGPTEYVNAATGEQVGYQTERGDIAINSRLIPKPSKVYPTVTRGGEYVQESTAPGTQYADPEGRIMVRETPVGLAISPGLFDPPPPDTTIQVATPQPVSNPDAPPPPPPPRQEPSLVDLALSSYSPLGGMQAVQDFAVSPAEMALPVVPVEDRAAWIRDHGLSPTGTLIDKIQDPTQSPSWYDYPLAALDVIGGVGAPVPGGTIARAGRLAAVPTRIVPTVVGTTVDVAKVIVKPVVRHINTERSVMTRMEQLWRQGIPYETAVKQARLEAQRIRPSQVAPTPQGQVSLMPPGSTPPLVGTTNNPNMILTMYSTPHGPVVAPAWYPWKNRPVTGSGGGSGGGTTPPGGTYRTQSGLLLDSSGNVVTEGAHPTSVAAQAYDATAKAVWSAATTPATAQVVPATTSGVISRVATTSTASAATPVLAPTPAQQSDVAPEVKPTKTTTLTPSVQFGPTVVTQPVPDTSTRFNARAEIQTPPVSPSPGVRQGVSIVPSYGATPMAATSSAQLFVADPVEAKAPTSRLQQSEPIDTPVTRVSTPASATTTTTETTPGPVVTQTVQPYPALGAVSTASSTNLGPVTTEIDPPPRRPPKKGRLKNRDNNTPQHQEDPGSVQDSKAGDHPHVSRWETHTVHQLDHRTGDHTSEVVDDTNVRTFQVVERGAESTSGKKWRANHLEVTSDQGKAVPAAVRFLRRPAEANATSTSEPKASKFSGLRAKAQQGARAVRTGATQGAQAARTGAVEARARFSAAGTRACSKPTKPHSLAWNRRGQRSRTTRARRVRSKVNSIRCWLRCKPSHRPADKAAAARRAARRGSNQPPGASDHR